MRQFVPARPLIAAAFLTSAWSAACAMPFINAPAPDAAPSVTLAVTYEMKLRLPEGRGLGSTYMSEAKGGCSAKVAATPLPGVDTLRLMRVTLYTGSKIVVVERRDGRVALECSATRAPDRDADPDPILISST